MKVDLRDAKGRVFGTGEWADSKVSIRIDKPGFPTRVTVDDGTLLFRVHGARMFLAGESISVTFPSIALAVRTPQDATPQDATPEEWATRAAE